MERRGEERRGEERRGEGKRRDEVKSRGELHIIRLLIGHSRQGKLQPLNHKVDDRPFKASDGVATPHRHCFEWPIANLMIGIGFVFALQAQSQTL